MQHETTLATAMIAVLLTACSQQNVTTGSVTEAEQDFTRLTSALEACVRSNAQDAYRRYPDRHAAVDFGFAACDGHTRALEFRLARHLPMSFAQQETQRHKERLRAIVIVTLSDDDAVAVR